MKAQRGYKMTPMSHRMSFSVLMALIGALIVVPWAESIKPIPFSDVAAVEKGTANLPCDITVPEHSKNLHDDVILVLWYREDLGTPIYSVDARDRSFQQAERWSDENVFGNRAYFRSNSRPAILAIENVIDADAAVYRCRVDFRVAQTRNAKVNLTVIAFAPNPPAIVADLALPSYLPTQVASALLSISFPSKSVRQIANS